jgi:hypothetical protein
MLDRLFLNKLSPRGKIMYWVGQLSLIALIAAAMFGLADMSWNDGETVFILGAVVAAIGWGFVCTLVWPIEAPRPIDAG